MSSQFTTTVTGTQELAYIRSTQACTAISSVPRVDAASKANPTAASLVAEPSTPTTTDPVSGGGCSTLLPRITTTGQCACAASATATEPTSMARKPPRPREPSTISAADSDCASSTADAE